MSGGSDAAQAIATKIAVSALQELATAATGLLGAARTKDVSAEVGDDPDSLSAQIVSTTANYVSDKFATTFGYIYDPSGATRPPNALPTGRVMSHNDFLAFDPTKYAAAGSLSGYVQAQYSGALPPGCMNTFTTNLVALIENRFNRGDTEWLPNNKTMLMPFTKSDGTQSTWCMDLFFVTACQTNSDGNDSTGMMSFASCGYESQPFA